MFSMPRQSAAIMNKVRRSGPPSVLANPARSSLIRSAMSPPSEEVRHLQDTGDLDADLRDLARRQLALVMQPRMMQLRRLVIGEAAPMSTGGPTTGVRTFLAAYAPPV